MPKLERNTNGEYYTRYSKNGTIFTIHFDNNIISYMNRKHIKIGDELPYSWRSDTMKWQYSHGVSAKKTIVSGLVNAKCPICGKPVFYYENEYGSKVYFDHAGDDWPKHPCTNNTYAHNSSLSKVNNLKIKFYNKNAIILVDEWKQYFMVSNFYLNKDKSMYTFYILKESDAPSKLIAIDNIAREFKIIKYGKDDETMFYNKIDLKNIHQDLSALYEAAEVFANTSAKFDALITRLAATIIYYTMATCDRQQGKTSNEANILLNFMQSKKPHEAQFLRTFLVEYGPFSISKSSQLMIKGRPPLIVKNSVKFSQVKFNNMGLSATEAAKRVMDCTFTEWKRNSIREAANYFKNIK